MPARDYILKNEAFLESCPDISSIFLFPCLSSGEKLVFLKSRLQQAMAIRRKEERERRAALHRLDNEDCGGEEEEEEEEDMTESEEEEV